MNYIYIGLGVIVLVITILALIGLNVKRQEKKLREQFNLDDTTTPDELKKAVERFKRKNLMTKKQLRDEWFSSKGYSVRYNSSEKEQLKMTRAAHSIWKKPISSYQSMVRQFMKLKHEKKIEIYYVLHDKYGIPYYEMRKSVAQQIRGIE